MTENENHGLEKRSILIGSKLGEYSRLMFNKPEGKESLKKTKTSLLCLKQVLSET